MTTTVPVLELMGVEKHYGPADQPVAVLRGVDLRVQPGEFVAILGASGSGKSTLLNLLGCLDRPSAGAYRLVGEDVARFDDRQLSIARRTRIGFVFQSFQLVAHLTVVENVELPLFYARLPRRVRRDRALALLGRVGLAHRQHHLPNQLSGGECQRAAIARALVGEPALLLADEPTGNLDSRTSREILDLFLELHQQGRTIVMITHDPGVAARAQRRIRMQDGRIQDADHTPPPAEVACSAN